MKKIMIMTLALTLIFAGCSNNTNEDVEKTTQPSLTEADAVTSASIVDEETALENALSENGTWIIAVLNDIDTDKELTIAGDFHSKNDSAQPLYRKLALYAQDDDHNVTDRYTLSAPKLTITSPNTRIQGGTFKGDVYVQADGFTVQDATIDGNVYFASQQFKDSFVLPEEEGKTGTVTGSIEVE